MSFCVECGREGPTIESVCADHFLKKHKLVRAPEYVDLTKCAHCGNLDVGGRWIPAALEDVMLDLIRGAAEKDSHVEKVRYTYDLRPQDPTNVAVTVKAACTVGPWELVDSFHFRVRVHNGMCPTCSKRAGRFFVGTVQVRADGRELTAEEVRRARDLVARSPTGEEFVSRVEDVAGGFDAMVSSNAFAKRLARDLSRQLGGTVGSSATLHTQKEGKDQYRSTYVVRLPGFREGDLLLWRRGKYRVVGLGPSVRLENPETGERVTVRLRELRNARVVPP